MKKQTKLLCLVLALMLVMSMFAGCGGSPAADSPTEAPENSQPEAPTDAPEAPDEPQTPPEEESKLYNFPIEDDITISVFTSIEASIAPYISDYNDLSLYRGWSEATGVDIDVTAVSIVAAKEMFTVMVSGDDTTDVIVQGGAWYPGGANSGVNDEVFLNLVDYKDYMPNYLAAIEKYGFENNVMSDDMISSFWQINANIFPIAGIACRGDLLDAVGMDHNDIKDFDDWTEMLRALKTQPGIKAPLALSLIGDMGTSVVLCGGFNTSLIYQNGAYVNLPLYVVDGEIKFGFLEDAYERYVSLISGWYKEGLINENIASMEGGPYAEDYVLRGENAVFMSMYSNMPQYADSIGGGAYFTPLYFPMENEGDTFHFSDSAEVGLESGVWQVGADSNYKELVVQMIDWFFTDEGCMLASYGIEGESYNIENGEIVLTDLIINNPDGLTPNNAMNIYAGDLVPTIKDSKRLLSTFNPEVVEAIEWSGGQKKDGEYSLPSGLSGYMTDEEQEIYNTYSGDLFTYMSENFLAFLTGQKDVSEIPAFRDMLIELGVQNIIDVYQNAYDRMMNPED